MGGMGMAQTAGKERKTVLVVDDNADFAEFVKSAAEMLGLHAVTLMDSNRFRELFETLSPDILVLDMVMPGIEGTEIVDWLAERKAPVRIVIVSGFNPLYFEDRAHPGRGQGPGRRDDLAQAGAAGRDAGGAGRGGVERARANNVHSAQFSPNSILI
jgi:CheY-like chemotaxis protein